MIAGKRYLGSQVDVWSTGVILYAMINGFLPFEDPNTSNLYKKILKGEFKISKSLSSDAQDLLPRILNVDPDKRYQISEIRKHPWY
jgi:5'-AMP-activated protein kinase catalytic alpha subunit